MFDPEDIEGYDKLKVESNKTLFKKFLENFYKSFEDTEEHRLVKVEFKMDKANGAYLKVTLIDGSWLHVKDKNTWY